MPAQSGLGFLVDEDARNGRKLEAKLTNGVPSSRTTRVDESHVVVAPESAEVNEVGNSQDNAIGISSSEEDSEDSEDEGEDEDEEPIKEKALSNGHLMEDDDGEESEAEAAASAEDIDIAEREAAGEENDEPEEPSFGDMLQARHPDPVDVQASFPDPMADRQALMRTTGDDGLTAPSGTSLTTVLTQALKTNDKDLLESCFHTKDLQSIRSTIHRLQSQHVATLLQRLAERIYKRPGRTGTLITWVQWSLIAHGGYLASQPDVMKKLKSLSQVIRERGERAAAVVTSKGQAGHA